MKARIIAHLSHELNDFHFDDDDGLSNILKLVWIWRYGKVFVEKWNLPPYVEHELWLKHVLLILNICLGKTEN